MNIVLLDISVRDLVEDYYDDSEGGITGYGGMLDIRPPYQREFVYEEKQRNAVINTLFRGLPLNVMYWADNKNGKFEIIDGQQRTISIAQYIDGCFSFEGQYFHNLTKDKQESIYDYKLMVYACSGTASEKLDWFKTINIAGEKLTNQELRNAVYSGTWLADAKRYFSRSNCAAFNLGKKYIKGKPIRQDYLQTVIKWISENSIEDYMGQHQHDEDAQPLWEYFQSVIKWVESNFTHYRTYMKGVNWGSLYNQFKDVDLNPDDIEKETARLELDDSVKRKSGIYPYILTREEKYLSIRTFSESERQIAFNKQSGICPECKYGFSIFDMEADHIIPWSKGGSTTQENCQVLCTECNRKKSDK